MMNNISYRNRQAGKHPTALPRARREAGCEPSWTLSSSRETRQLEIEALQLIALMIIAPEITFSDESLNFDVIGILADAIDDAR